MSVGFKGCLGFKDEGNENKETKNEGEKQKRVEGSGIIGFGS